MVHFANIPELRRPGYRYLDSGIGFPETSRPYIRKSLDGPLLIMRDGTLHWLTLWERFMVWLCWDDAMTIEARRRPDLIDLLDDVDTVPCIFCRQPAGPDGIADVNGEVACRPCGEAEISAQRAEGTWK